MIIVLMGVAGCGKTTVGVRLAKLCGWRFFDADDFHPPANVAKMASGDALNDADREPWLARLNAQLLSCERSGECAVLACSALKRAYRERLAQDVRDLRFVYLRGDYATIERRLLARPGHYMKAGLLASQFQVLEEPAGALVVDIAATPAAIVERIRQSLPTR